MEPTARDKLNMSKDVTPNITTDTGPALVSTLIVVNAVLVACVVVGGCFIAVQLLKKLRKELESQEHDEVSVGLAETGSLVHGSSRHSLSCTYSTGHVYETIEHAGSL
jgi:cell division protein FtsX